MQQKTTLHSLPRGPSATNGHSAQPSKWPWCNKRPLCTAFQVAPVQQRAALHCCTQTRHSFRTAALRNPIFCFKLCPAFTTILHVGTFGGCSNWGLQYCDHRIQSSVSGVQMVFVQNSGFPPIIYKIAVYDVFKHRLQIQQKIISTALLYTIHM